ncbi:unnamed protein product [Darwinula stevensoni]|uniref:RAE1/2 domain-containing protein n=1 Tax=Darwinula stevensoni TaxID=69355 RepID=A0A7R8X3R4_9CRUS|nr:unnamed protein product [Darwinula stevensoni]CAG0882808.1 unnamed protein product [Darwinula stevensoni]
MNLVHLMTNGTSQDLEVVIQSHFHITDDSERTAEEKPAVLWYCIYEDQDDSRSEFLDAELPQGLFFVPGQSWELDFDSHVQQARTVFERMYPGEDFLPRAPDPEDIVVLDPPAPEPEQQERNNEEDGDVTEEDVDENRRGTEEVRENEGRDQGEVEAGAVKEDVDGE